VKHWASGTSCHGSLRPVICASCVLCAFTSSRTGPSCWYGVDGSSRSIGSWGHWNNNMKPDVHLVCYSRMRARARESARSIPVAVRVGAGLSDKRTTSSSSVPAYRECVLLPVRGGFAEPDGSTSTGKKEWTLPEPYASLMRTIAYSRIFISIFPQYLHLVINQTRIVLSPCILSFYRIYPDSHWCHLAPSKTRATPRKYN